MGVKILLVDDQEVNREPLKKLFLEKGYTVLEAADGEEALDIYEMEKETLTMILLDVMMPKLDGWSVLRRIRRESKIPIVMITARETDEDELFGFELGVDEYITKPYNLKVAEARIEALLKQQNSRKKEQVTYANMSIDFEGRVVTVDGEKVDLALREYELLIYLIQNEGIALSREKILSAVWNYEYYGDTRTIDNHVKKIRGKIGKAGDYIETVRGVGYTFRSK